MSSEPSQARDALQSLAVSGLTLEKKKSWFGSLRDVVHKSALQAKSTVDSFRADQTNPDS